MFDLIIIGGGPAGTTAGIYAGRKKLNTLVISKDFTGQTGKAFSIENYPGIYKVQGAKLIERFKKQLKKFLVDINMGEEVTVIKKNKKGFFEVATTQKDRYFAKSIIIASGSNPRSLKIPGEKKFIGRGVSYCTVCDAPFFKDKIVSVVGGGNSGVEAALDLTKHAKKVYILEFSSDIKADEFISEKAKKNKKIEIICNAVLKKINGDKKVSSIIYEDVKSKKTKELLTEGVFIQIGYVPTASFAEKLVNINKRGEIEIDFKTNQTKTKGLFAAGDVSSIPHKQIVIAAGEGAKAALSCYNYLKDLEK